MQQQQPDEGSESTKKPRARRNLDIRSGTEPANVKDPIKPRAKVVVNAQPQDTEEQRQLKEALRARNDELKRQAEERRQQAASAPPPKQPINDPIYDAKQRALKRKIEEAEQRGAPKRPMQFDSVEPKHAFFAGVFVGAAATIAVQRLLGGSGGKAAVKLVEEAVAGDE